VLEVSPCKGCVQIKRGKQTRLKKINLCLNARIFLKQWRLLHLNSGCYALSTASYCILHRRFKRCSWNCFRLTANLTLTEISYAFYARWTFFSVIITYVFLCDRLLV
jgi:hypothetical protein